MRWQAWTAAAVIVVAGCTSGTTQPAPTPSPQATAVEAPAGPDVQVRGRDVLLRADGDKQVIASLDADEGRVHHAALRPGDHDRVTVLLLTAVDGRYELRYVVVGDDGPSDVYWLPWRLQVAEDLAVVADVAPLPVWAPDGSAFAWLEWDADGTLLRTVAWRDTPEGGNPSDQAAAYRIAEVPAGAQLVRWAMEGAKPVLVASGHGMAWRIELDLDDGETYALLPYPTPLPAP